jgi:hypothetical protein
MQTHHDCDPILIALIISIPPLGACVPVPSVLASVSRLRHFLRTLLGKLLALYRDLDAIVDSGCTPDFTPGPLTTNV